MDTQELIGKIENGDMADAGKAFTDLMNQKVQAALDDRKVELGNQMHLSPEELEELEKDNQAELEDEDFDEDEDEASEEEDDDELEEDEEVDEDEDVQSDETEPQ
tara:strand:+ start:314 stop:628 length:315 start_codon:yes stop_codon:yes gene_type:complete